MPLRIITEDIFAAGYEDNIPFETRRKEYIEKHSNISDIETEMELLRSAIRSNDSAKLENLLKKKFVYSFLVDNKSVVLASDWYYEQFYSEVASRPLIEAIYVDHPDYFNNILELMNEHESLKNTFLSQWCAIIKTDGKLSDLPSNLFELKNEKSIADARLGLRDMRSHAYGTDKSGCINSTCSRIEKQLKLLELNRNNPFKIAQAKQAIFHELNNDGLKKHRHPAWLHAVGNVAAPLLLFIPWIMNKMVNGYWFFGSKTISQGHAQSIQRNIMDPSEQNDTAIQARK